MLRLFVLLLLLANLGYWAWSGGYLRDAGFSPAVEREPERLARQLRPEALTVQPLAAPLAAAAMDRAAPAPAPVAVTAAAATSSETQPSASAVLAAASAPAMESGACLQVGAFDDKQIEAVRHAAAALPSGSWRIEQVTLPSRWMVYIGKLADASAVAAKRAEVRALGVDTDRPGPDFEPGLSLGRFSSEEAAQRALTGIAKKGVRSAHVVQDRNKTPSFILRLPAADAAQRAQLRTLHSVLGDREVRPCS